MFTSTETQQLEIKMRLITLLAAHGIDCIEQDGNVYAVSVAYQRSTDTVTREWVVVDVVTVREFLGY